MDSEAAILYEPVEDLSESSAATIERIDVAEPTGEEVLVDIAAASLCYTDVSAALGEKVEPYPVVMGHEGAGIVRAVGERVESVTPGDHVVLGRIACGKCDPCRGGQSNLCRTRRSRQSKGMLRTGARAFRKGDQTLNHFHGVSSFTEHTVVTEDVAIRVTDDIPLEEATILGCGVFTGFGAATNTVDVELGSSIVVFGCGGVGLSALQGAVMRGASTRIAVDPIDEKRATAESLGATHTIDPTAGDPVAEIESITDGGVDYAFEAVGRPSVAQQAVDTLGPKGTAVLVGTSPQGAHAVDLDLRDLTTSEKRIVGSFNGSYNLSLAIPQLAQFVVDGDLSLTEMISGTRPLSDLDAAMRDLQSGSEKRQIIVP